MFPRLRILEISIAAVHAEETKRITREELPTTGNFQGYLHLWGLSEAHNDFIAFLSSTSPRFKTICIDGCETGKEMWKLLNSSAASLESLELSITDGDLGVNMISLSECTQLREVTISHPYPESTTALLQTVHSPYLKKFVVYFRLWSYGNLITDEEGDMLRKADDELRAVYDQWADQVMGTIEVFFCVPTMDKSDGWLEGYQEGVKKFFPRLTENVTVTIVC